jgi:hypothetical protein
MCAAVGLPSLTLFEVAVNLSTGIVVQQERDSFQTARWPGRVMVSRAIAPNRLGRSPSVIFADELPKIKTFLRPVRLG